MVTIAEQLTQACKDKETIVANLNTMGVQASNDETLTSLAPKILDIKISKSTEQYEPICVFSNYNEQGFPTVLTIKRSYLAYMLTNIGYKYVPSVPSHFLCSTSNKSTGAFPVTRFITNVNILSDIVGLADGCFLDHINLQKVNGLDNILYIDQHVFAGCTNLLLDTLPPNLVTLGVNAFGACPKITVSEIPNGITSLKGQTFNQCTSITQMTFNSDFQKMGYKDFERCTKLTKLIMKCTNVPTIESTTFSNSGLTATTGEIYVLDDLVEQYKTATNWSTYANIIKPMSELASEVSK